MKARAKHTACLLSSSTTKKVCVRRFGQIALEGFVYPQDFLRRDGIELLARTAEALVVPYEQVRAVYFVREFGEDPGQSQRKLFSSRPKRGGLWVRMRFLDGEELEGVMPNDLRIFGQHGVTLMPPDSKGNTQRVFVPNQALDEFVVRGVIGKPQVAARGRRRIAAEDQFGLFPADAQPPDRGAAAD